jgi:hypothetical protein
LNKLAPILLFVYNRPWHTRKTVKALKNNELASESELFIYADGAKNDDALRQVKEVRDYIKTIDGFKKIIIIEQDENIGLANSIISGVTKVVNEYGKIIVIEDDIFTSPYFLKFMNEALKFYKDKDRIWHVSGWNYPIDSDNLEDVFISRLMNCWGWATWADKWQYYEKNIDKTIKIFSKEDVNSFNLDGSKDFFEQVIENKKKKIDTWAIFWYVTIFKKDGLCVNPTQTFVENIGNDGSGVHCGKSETYVTNISMHKDIKFITKISENKTAFERIQGFYKAEKRSLPVRVVNKLARIMYGKNIIQ